MTQEDISKILIGNQFNQFYVDNYEYDETQKRLTINFQRLENIPYTCINCGQQCLFAYDCLKSRIVEDLPVTDSRLFLRFTPVRIYCPHCKTIHIEKTEGLSPHSRQTNRFKLFIAKKCENSSISAIAREYNLDDDTVRRIDKEYLQKRLVLTQNNDCEELGIDEIAIKKGHIYATVFYDHKKKCVIDVIPNRDAASVGKFFESKGVEWCSKVKVVSCDLWKAYKLVVKKYLPNAKITTDKFHVHKYANDALDMLRRSEIAEYSNCPEINIKKAKFLILTPYDKLDIKGQKRIETLKASNNCLYTGYLLKEQVFSFYALNNKEDAEIFLHSWASSCIASKIKPFIQLGRRLLKNAETILEYFTHRISNGFAEGINNKIKVIKRVAYGFRDFEYFRLKILASTGFLAPLPSYIE